jgi:hypothetical protein
VPLLTELTMVRMQIRYMMHLSNLSGPASTTLTLLGSSLSAKHDAFWNRKLRERKFEKRRMKRYQQDINGKVNNDLD